MSDWIDIAALAKILAIGLVGGAGLAAVFAFGLVGLTAHQEARTAGGGSPVALAGAGFAFLVVLAGVVLGVYVMLSA
ncbi:MAG: hypothetical protein H0V10_09220 [Geodermatophilaceae bacterium]|nr:hypothetical protein [Geodermatophilaceae bacterium]